METGEQKITAAVAGEQPTGAVRAVRSRGKTNDEQPGTRVAKTRDGSAVIVPAGIALDLVGGDIDAVATQPRTGTTGRNQSR